MSRARATPAVAFNYWPGFVDAMATLLLVIIFLLSVFMLAQFFLAQEVGGKDAALLQLKSQIAELVELLALSQEEKASLESELSTISATLSDTQSEAARLRERSVGRAGADTQSEALPRALEDEKALTAAARAQAELLNQQISALRRQLGAIEAALEVAEKKDRESQARIVELGRRLNTALAQKVQELARYRSQFFAALRNALGNQKGIRIVGDRFVLPSEIVFESGSADITPRGRWELRKISEVLGDVAGRIPEDITWILRVDGHTDAAPIATPQYPSNWHLSAARAIAVVDYLIEQGTKPERLLAAGFSSYQPIDTSETQDAFRRNRRIEFKLTQR